MDIKKRLLTYNKTIADLEILAAEIEILKLKYDCFDEAGETFKPQVYEEGMPIHFGNEFNSKTENIAVRKEDMPLHIKKMELKYREVEHNKIIVDAKLKLLNNHERFIIRKKYFDELKYNREISRSYEIEFNFYISKSTLRRLLNTCFEKMNLNWT